MGPSALLLLPALVLHTPGRHPRQEGRMELRSPAFTEGASIPRVCTADGLDQSPALQWSEPPAGTRAFALVVEDPDAPRGTWIHWVLYDLPAATRDLAGDQPRSPELPGGGRQGRNSWGRLGWNGPAPPPGPAHHYRFRLFALASPLALAPGAPWEQVAAALRGKVLGESTLIGRFGR